MRVDCRDECDERRDALDQRWFVFFQLLGFFPVPVPNNSAWLDAYLHNEEFDGILLTGGNSLYKYGGEANERDTVEDYLLSLAIRETIPVLGVCRGMQVIQNYFGITLQTIKGHVNHRHRFRTVRPSFISAFMEDVTDVNAFHTLGVYEDNMGNRELQTILTAEDGVVIAVAHQHLPIYGIMWHPEREDPPREADKKICRQVYDSA